MHDNLTAAEAARRLARDGPDELPLSRPQGVLRLLREVVTEPMFLPLLACGAICVVPGDRHESFMLPGFAFVVMAITFVQQRRTQRSLAALHGLPWFEGVKWGPGRRIRQAQR